MGAFAESQAAQQQAALAAPRRPSSYAAPEDVRTGEGLGGLIGNLGADIGDLVGGLWGLIGTGISEAVTQPTNVLKEFGTLGFADTPVNVLTPALVPHMLGAVGSDIKDRYLEGDIGQEMYDHPLSFILDATAVAGAASAGARAAVGEGMVYGRIGKALLSPEKIAENRGLLELGREARLAQASEGIETLADVAKRFGELPQAARRKAQWLDRLVPEPMRVAEPIAGHTFEVAKSRNPLVHALWSRPVRERFLEGAPMFEKRMNDLKALGDAISEPQLRQLNAMEAAFGRMQVGVHGRPAQYVTGAKYGRALATRQRFRIVDRVLGKLKANGILDRQRVIKELRSILKNSGVPEDELGRFEQIIQGLDEGKVAAMDPEVLLGQLQSKGFESLEDAAQEMLHQGGKHTLLDTDERNGLASLLRDGKIASEAMWRYVPDADIAELPERLRFEGQLRAATEQMGLPRHQQDLMVAVYDSFARGAARETYGGDVDAFYGQMSAEFADSWTAGVRDELTQRTKKVLRGVVHYRGGKPIMDVERLADFVKRSGEGRDWYPNARAFIADITQGGRHRLPDGREIRDSELFADVLAATSIGLLPAQQLPAALAIYTMIKDGTYEGSVFRGTDGKALQIANLLDAGPATLTQGRSGPAVARFVDEIAHGHTINDWEAEIAMNGGDVVMDDLLDMTRRDAPLEWTDRQKIRAYAARLKGLVPDETPVIDRRVNLFFGVFTGETVWEQVLGQIRPSKMGFDTPDQIRGKRYLQLSDYIRQVRDHLNDSIGPNEAPYGLEEVQSIMWARTREFLEDEAERVRKAIAHKSKAKRQDLEHYLQMVTASMTERMDPRGYSEAWTDLLQTKYGQSIQRKLQSFLNDPSEFAQRIANEVKGSTIFGPDFSKLIRFYRTGDFTTVVHELGHVIRRTMPRQVADQLHGIYFTRAHGVADPSDIFEEAGDELFQTTGVGEEPEYWPMSNVARGAYAAARQTTTKKMISEGQWVKIKGKLARVRRIADNKAGATMVEGEIFGEATPAGGALKRSRAALDDVEIVPELDPDELGLADPLGYLEEGSSGASFKRWNDIETGKTTLRVKGEDKGHTVEAIRVVPSVENGNVKARIAVKLRGTTGPHIDFKGQSHGWYFADELDIGAAKQKVKPDTPIDAQMEKLIGQPKEEPVGATPGVTMPSALRRDIDRGDGIIERSQTPDSVMEGLEERFGRRPEVEDVRFDAYHPLFKAAQEEGIFIAGADYVVADQPLGTRVAIQGQPLDEAEIGVVVEMDPRQVRLGNDILKSKAQALAEETGPWRAMPLVFKHGDDWIVVEGNHRIWRSRQLGQEKVKVVAFRGDKVIDQVGGPVREGTEAQLMVEAHLALGDARKEGVGAPRKGTKARAAYDKNWQAWLDARTPEAIAGVAAMGKPHPLEGELVDHLDEMWSGGVVEHMEVDHGVPADYVEALGGHGPYVDAHAKMHGFDDRFDAMGQRIERKLDQEDVRAELDEHDDLGEESPTGRKAGDEVMVETADPGFPDRPPGKVTIKRYDPDYGRDGAYWVEGPAMPHGRWVQESGIVDDVRRDVQAESHLSDAEEAARQDEFGARMNAEADAKAARLASEADAEFEAAEALPAIGKEADRRAGAVERDPDLIYDGIDNPPTPPELPTGPPELPPWRPWTRQMEEAFAEDLEKWFYNKIQPPDRRTLGALRAVSEGLIALWGKVRGFTREHQLIPEEAAQTFDRYLGKAFLDVDLPMPSPIAGTPRRVRQIPEAGDLSGAFPDGRQVRQATLMDVDPETGVERPRRLNADEMRSLAYKAAPAMGEALRPLFGDNVVVDVKGMKKIKKALKEGLRVTDASRGRVVLDNWQRVDEAVQEIASKVDVVGIEDTRRIPGTGGLRGVKLYVKDAETGFISELEVGTEFYSRFRDSTYAHDHHTSHLRQQLRKEEQMLARAQQAVASPGAAQSIAEHQKAIEELQMQVTSMDRYMEGHYEMIADEIAADAGRGIPLDETRALMNELRLWVSRNIEADLIDDGYFDAMAALERVYLPQRIRSGAEWWEGEKVSDGQWINGESTIALDDARASAGLPMPIYFPHIESPGAMTDFVIQQTGAGAKKLAYNKNLRRNRGILFQEGNYITDIGEAYARRAARAIKMRDTYEMVAQLARATGRRIASTDDLVSGEVVMAPEFLQAFVKVAIGIEDRMGALLSKMDDAELVGAVSELNAKIGRQMAPDILAEGIRAVLDVGEREQGALYLAVSEAIPLVQRQLLAVNTKGLELYAIPRDIATRMRDATKYNFGPGVKLFWDKPTQFWRALTLYGRPAWVINNIFGNTMQAKIGGVKLSEILHAALDKDYRWYVDELGKAGGPDVKQGFMRSQDQYPVNLGRAEETVIGETVAKLEVRASNNRALKIPRTIGDAMKRVNVWWENAFRSVGYVEGLRKTDSLRLTQRGVKRFWGSKEELQKMLVDGITEEHAAAAMDKMQDWFGDYTTMRPFERGVVRRFVLPFWGFYRHMAKLLVKLPFDYPAKMAVIRSLALVERDIREEFGPVPTWMDGMVPFGGVNEDGTYKFLSVAGPNPFNAFMDTGLGMLHPAVKAGIEQLTGRDAYTGREFSDPDVFSPFGSDNRYQIIRGPDGVPIDAVPVDKVTQSLPVSLLSQIPQYDMAKQVLAGGRTYDTVGLLGAAREGPITDATGEPVAPYGVGDALSRLAGASTYDYDIAAFQARQAKEREDALMQAYERWAETHVGSAVGVG